MHRKSVSRFFLGPAALLLVSGCTPEYHPPSLATPHATVWLFRDYAYQPGTHLRELFTADDRLIYSAEVTTVPGGTPRVDSRLVFPMSETFSMSASFFHYETRNVYETYIEDIPEPGSGEQRCSVLAEGGCQRTRPEKRHRWAARSVEVTDTECHARVRFAPKADRVYLAQFQFKGDGSCWLGFMDETRGQ